MIEEGRTGAYKRIISLCKYQEWPAGKPIACYIFCRNDSLYDHGVKLVRKVCHIMLSNKFLSESYAKKKKKTRQPQPHPLLNHQEFPAKILQNKGHNDQFHPGEVRKVACGWGIEGCVGVHQVNEEEATYAIREQHELESQKDGVVWPPFSHREWVSV